MIIASTLPLLFFVAPAWCAFVRFQARLEPLDRILCLYAICIMGLLRTVSDDAAYMIVGLLPTEFQIRQRLMKIHLR